MPRTANPGAAAKRVLVIKLSALGDFVLAMGAARVVRAFHPNAEITLLTTPPFRGLAEASPYFDRIWTDGRPKGLRATLALFARLRQAGFDMVYDFQTSGRSKNYFQALRPNPPPWSGISPGCAFPHDRPGRGKMHTIERLADQLEMAGVGPEGLGDWPPLPDFAWVIGRYGGEERMTPAHFGLTGPYALLIPGASPTREAKRWPAERYAALAGFLADQGLEPAVIGGPAEAELSATLCALEPRIRNLVGKTDFFQIIALGAGASLAVGNDTGPMHLASLAGAPGVALFATTESDPAHARPRGGQVEVVCAPTLGALLVEPVIDAVRRSPALTARGA